MWKTHASFSSDSSLSCCLDCFKKHKIACAQAPDGPHASVESKLTATTDKTVPAQTLQQIDLEALFAQHPALRTALIRIYQSTQDPRPASEEAGYTKLSQARPWTEERGLDAGLRALQSSISRGDAAANGIAAFMKLLEDRGLR